MKRTPKVLVGACLAVLVLAVATLAAMPLVASTVTGERVGAILSSMPALAELPLIVGTDKGEQIKGTRHAEMIMGLGGPWEGSLGKGQVFEVDFERSGLESVAIA